MHVIVVDIVVVVNVVVVVFVVVFIVVLFFLITFLFLPLFSFHGCSFFYPYFQSSTSPWQQGSHAQSQEENAATRVIAS